MFLSNALVYTLAHAGRGLYDPAQEMMGLAMTKLTMVFAAGRPLFLLCSLAYSTPSLETK